MPVRSDRMATREREPVSATGPQADLRQPTVRRRLVAHH
jgi:hypothetical protein